MPGETLLSSTSLVVSTTSGPTTVSISSSCVGTTKLFLVGAMSLITAPVGIRRITVPAVVGVTVTLKTPGSISLMSPTVMLAVPALLKSAAVTLLASMLSLKVTT